jgi:hypothetical protein
MTRRLNHWTMQELATLKSLMEINAPRSELCRKLPRHSEASITRTASKRGYKRNYGKVHILAAIKSHVFQTSYKWRI